MKVSGDIFASKFESFKEGFKTYLPNHQQSSSIEISIKPSENGLPDIQNAKQKLYFIHRFFFEGKNKTIIECIFTPSGEMDLEMKLIHHALDRNHERFSPFFRNYIKVCTDLVASLLPEAKIKTASLIYHNLLSRRTTPTFVNLDGSLKVGELLTVFSKFPVQSEGMTSPYLCKVGFVISHKDSVFVNLEIAGLLQKVENATALQVIISGIKVSPDQTMKPVDVFQWVDILHEQVRQKFEIFFTDAAKLTFKPDNQATPIQRQ